MPHLLTVNYSISFSSKTKTIIRQDHVRAPESMRSQGKLENKMVATANVHFQKVTVKSHFILVKLKSITSVK